MRLTRLGLAVLTGMALSACGGEQAAQLQTLQAEVLQLKAENAALRKELEDLKTTPAALLASVRKALSEGHIGAAREAAGKLRDRHPDAPELAQATQAIAEFDARVEAERLAAEQKKKAEAEAAARRIAAATARMSKEHDAINRITRYQDRSTPPYADGEEGPRLRFFLYFAKFDSGTSPILRLRAEYWAERWLFAKSITIAADEARFETGKLDFERDNSGGDIWEWHDVTVTATELAWVKAIIASKSATIRFHGDQYYSDRKITSSQRAALQNVLDAYVALGGQLPE